MSGASNGKRAYILLAEDEPTNQYVFRAILQTGGYEVEIVENGELALAAGRRRKPDLVLLDMMMPVKDGYDTAREMIRDSAFDGVPIIALTAKAMKGDAEKTLEAGCDDYMSKPVRRAELIQKIEEWLSKDPSEWMPAREAKRSSPPAEAA